MRVKKLKRVAVLMAVVVLLVMAGFNNCQYLNVVSARDCIHSIVKVTVVGAACAEMAAFLWCLVRK